MVFEVAGVCQLCSERIQQIAPRYYTLASYRGIPQKVVDRLAIGQRYERGKWLQTVPVVCVVTRDE